MSDIADPPNPWLATWHSAVWCLVTIALLLALLGGAVITPQSCPGNESLPGAMILGEQPESMILITRKQYEALLTEIQRLHDANADIVMMNSELARDRDRLAHEVKALRRALQLRPIEGIDWDARNQQIEREQHRILSQ